MQTTFNKGDIVKSIDNKVVILLSEDGIYTPQPAEATSIPDAPGT